MFSKNVVDGGTYTLARFVAGGAAPYACIAPQIPVCFTPGTKITTPDGPQLMESLIPGDLVTTQDHGNQQISWIERTRFKLPAQFHGDKLRPVWVLAGSLGLACLTVISWSLGNIVCWPLHTYHSVYLG